MSDPVAATAEGFANAALDYTEEKLKAFIQKFKSRDLAFIEDPKNIQTVKNQRTSAEFVVLRPFIGRGWFPIVIEMGLALREYELNKDDARRDDLRGKVVKRFGQSGLHIAELTQNGIIMELVTKLISLNTNPADVQRKTVAFLDQVDFLAIFVKRSDMTQVDEMAAFAKVRVDANPSRFVIVFGAASAKPVVSQILDKIKEDKRGFIIETDDVGSHITSFVFAPEVRAKVTSWVEAISDEDKLV